MGTTGKTGDIKPGTLVRLETSLFEDFEKAHFREFALYHRDFLETIAIVVL